MNATHRLALWLVLAADAMFYLGLLGAGRVMPHAIERGASVRDMVAVGLLIMGRIVLCWRKLSVPAALFALSALLLMTPMLRPPVDSQWLLHAVVCAHIAALATATFALFGEINLLWEFIIVLGCMLIASAK